MHRMYVTATVARSFTETWEETVRARCGEARVHSSRRDRSRLAGPLKFRGGVTCIGYETIEGH